uniref:Uncharacterized protein n=1 Tax=Rhizophora mucronata TaxID=61149 RepID=A0A2P2N4E1_RHIMU
MPEVCKPNDNMELLIRMGKKKSTSYFGIFW